MPCLTARTLFRRRVSMGRLPSAGLAALALAFALGGCHTSEYLEPSAASVLVTAEPLEITLASALRGWKESAEPPGSQTRFRLGKLLAHLFPAQDGRAFLSPVKASLETGWNSRAATWEARYSFDLMLQLDGVSHEVRAQGAGVSEQTSREAERAALQECVGEIYVQAAALLAGKGS